MSDHAANARRTTSGHRALLSYGMRALVYIAFLAPTSVLAQSGDAVGSRFAFEPRFGLWWARLDDSADIDRSNGAGWFSALRLTTAMTPRIRGVVSVGYARLDEASVETIRRPNGDVLTATSRLEIVPVTAGVEVDLNRGTTVVSLGFEAGAGWSRSPVTSRTGPPPIFVEGDELSRDWSVGVAFLPSITLRRAMSSGLGLSFSVQSFWDEGTFEQGDFLLAPVASVGIRWPLR